VAALLGRGMGTVLGDLAEVGVDAEWHCIPASAVGAPHIRDRVWIIAKPQYPDPDEPGPHRAAMHERGIPAEFRDEQVCLSGPLGEALADADQPRLAKRETDAGRPSEARRRQPRHPSVGSGNWRTEPDVDRVAHGVPARVDRLRSLGNAVVPQIPELIGRAILSAREP
jgi:DNA (cytosine-5)-methyltransferase 1